MDDTGTPSSALLGVTPLHLRMQGGCQCAGGDVEDLADPSGAGWGRGLGTRSFSLLASTPLLWWPLGFSSLGLFFYSFEEEFSGSNFSSLRFSLLFFQMAPRVLSLELDFGLHVSCRLKCGGRVGGGMCLPYFPGLGGWEFD